MQLLPRPGQMKTTGHVQGAPTQKGAFSAGENSVCAGGPHGHKAEHPKASGPGTSPFEGTSVTHTVGLCWPCRAWVLLLAAHLATPGQPAKGAVAAKTMLGPSSVTGAKGTTKLTRLGAWIKSLAQKQEDFSFHAVLSRLIHVSQKGKEQQPWLPKGCPAPLT